MKDSNNRIPFGLKNGRMVGVEEVARGLACGCMCPSCGGILQANKGDVRAHYFSHDPTRKYPVCYNAFETAVHQMAKQILMEYVWIYLPTLEITRSKSDVDGDIHKQNGVAFTEAIMRFTRVESEKRLDIIRPDIVAYSDNKALLIEVAVTHFADNNKKMKIRNLRLDSIEINLSKVDYSIKKSDLRKLILEDKKNRKWLSKPSALKVIAEVEASLNERIHEVNSAKKEARLSEQRHLDNLLTSDRGEQIDLITTDRRRQIDEKELSEAIPNKDYTYRSFVCESCHHMFRVPVQHAPYSLKTIKCPECGHSVSTKELRRYRI